MVGLLALYFALGAAVDEHRILRFHSDLPFLPTQKCTIASAPCAFTDSWFVRLGNATRRCCPSAGASPRKVRELIAGFGVVDRLVGLVVEDQVDVRARRAPSAILHVEFHLEVVALSAATACSGVGVLIAAWAPSSAHRTAWLRRERHVG